MKTKSLAGATLVALLLCASMAKAQVSATANGGAGGAGGSAAGGTATGGTATGGTSSNTNSTTGGTSSATGGTNSATGNTSSIGSATSNYQGADVSVNYTTPAGAAGLHGLAAGVDPVSGHVVSDNNVNYSGTTKIKNTPDVNIGGPASGICNGLSGGVGVGIPGLAIAGNISTVDKGCEARETARIAAMLGRMDVANAILENMDVVMSAMKARNDREAQAAAALAVQSQASNARRAAAQADIQAAAATARQQEAETMRAQQQAGVDALARQATMQKVNDTLTFTGKLTQGEEKTPQQLMAEKLMAEQSAAQQSAPPTASSAPFATPAAAQGAAPSTAQTETPPQAVGTPESAEYPLRVSTLATARAAPPDHARQDVAPSAPTANGERSAVRAQATSALVKPTMVARQQAPDSDRRTERKQKAAEQVDAVRFALNLDDDGPPVAALAPR